MGLGVRIFAATLAMASVAAAGGWAAFWLLRPEAARGPGYAVARIGAMRLRYDPAYASARQPGDGSLEIVARFPSFAPVGPGSPGRGERLVFVDIEEADPILPPEDRTAKLYERFLQTEQWTNPGGLIMRRFEAGSPYEREELYFAPPEGRLFAARCTRPRQPPDGLPESCIADFRVDNLDAHLRFQPDLLPDWERLLEGSRTLVERMLR